MGSEVKSIPMTPGIRHALRRHASQRHRLTERLVRSGRRLYTPSRRPQHRYRFTFCLVPLSQRQEAPLVSLASPGTNEASGGHSGEARCRGRGIGHFPATRERSGDDNSVFGCVAGLGGIAGEQRGDRWHPTP
ncbi:hypothetical protein E2C01_053671 [Portunus trituberculatus]|uniref:Uncharacterized protein n=1 Tax=Portunus trituberculatus TaxID=210409 RepID=A0A5B7GR42_PORTR|nr:hypothetical protein [Portunus trituberculatus]